MDHLSRKELAKLSPEEKIERMNLQHQERDKSKKDNLRKMRALHLSWERMKKEKALKELIIFFEKRKEMNQQVANDGVGIDPHDGSQVRFTNEQRISFIDQNKGIDEVLAYIDRRANL